MKNPDYSIRQLVEMDACTHCRLCAEGCPAALAGGDGTLSAVYRLSRLREHLKGKSGFLQKWLGRKALSKEELRIYSDTVFRCTLCGNCQEVCPVGIHLKEIWFSLRRDLTHSGAFPKQIERIPKNILHHRNVFAEENAERVDWVEDMHHPPKDKYLKKHAEVIYFAGCVASYFPRAQKIPIALAEILTYTGVDFALLGEEEWCCGFPLLGAGFMESFDEIREHNLASVRKMGAKTAIFACPSCYQMWRDHYGAHVELLHVTEFLQKLIRSGKLTFKSFPITLTYHDPCDLGRGARIFAPPREIIRSIPDVILKELPRNKENCRCCGGGGNLEMMDTGLTAQIARLKVEEVLSTKSLAVVTSCQQCVRTITTYVKRNKIPIEVMDLVELVRKAMVSS
ncbi:MAG: (Fe-S)-binding protein [Thermodesulfobacteriota bacterium]